MQNGATATASGLVRQAFTFDGVDDFVNVPNNAALEPKQITVDLWVNSANPGSAAYLLAKGAQGCSYASYSFNNVPGDNVANGDLAFDVVVSGNILKRSPGVPKAMVFDGNWHHVTALTMARRFASIWMALKSAAEPMRPEIWFMVCQRPMISLSADSTGPARSATLVRLMKSKSSITR